MSVDGIRLDAVVHSAAGSPRGAVVLVHGITVDMDEGGKFVRLAERLAATGFGVLRYSDQGFDSRHCEDEAIVVSADWLVEQHRS
jgi:alpha-beta hydrolase superfamily lysophospholipase